MPIEAVVTLVVAILVFGLWLGIHWVRWQKRRRGRHFALRGARGEEAGIRLLEDAGYEVLDTQVRAVATVAVDGDPEVYDLWIDAIVLRQGRRYVAEFKTGNVASIGHASTRRQMLEYALAFPDHDLLLVNASDGTLHEVAFPRLQALVE